MHLFNEFSYETYDETGKLIDFKLKYNSNYNFAYDVVDRMAQIAPSQTAMVWARPREETRRFSFADISRLSNQAANVLKANGVKKGDTVLVILKRNYEYWYIAPALQKLGAVVIPATHLLKVEDLVYRIRTAGISAAVGTPDGSTIEDLLEAKRQCPELKTIFAVRKKAEGTVDFTEEMKNAPETLTRVDTKVSDPMLVYFTSGTTGYPKAVVHDHTYSLSHIVTARFWQNVQDGGLHLTVAETGWGKASWGKLYGHVWWRTAAYGFRR